ncbi:L-aminoadipate-semialdehyde dehydrogenase [Saccharomycopsis crataegensis]|uniref:Alpha-aminoadipate reductase n=1 Tax=Saccharomycopsis crataegensis TaxID=43959 RepID=A0AAV5QI91_9ASCO|nr:L-aminoadipate-semialdehyde dehydrogenase [Saccharomycopsis crataegensis]
MASVGSAILSVPTTHQDLDNYFVLLSTYVSILYRFTNVDDIVFALSNYTTKSHSYIRYNVPETPLSFSELYKALQSSIKESQSFQDSEALTHHLKKNVELSFSQLRDFNNYSFNIVDSDDTAITATELFEFAINYNKSSGKFIMVYNKAKYSEERVSSLIEQFSQFLNIVIEDSTSIITRVPLLTSSQISHLPDPTIDLDWSGYVGGIHEIFERNAKQWPERTCVIETSDLQGSNNRVFTYQQINESSNMIAHYLVDNGIKVGDIIAIYSYRSVELLICVLGILKAGGTFCVIDPAYPPFRQNIYLDVAQPAGLIVIGRAGELDNEVESFIDDKLDLKARLSKVALQNTGVPTGGVVPGTSTDCLDQYLKVKDQGTGVKVGPDSNPTLAFTSGSEGLPKGVLGRHFSLAYYFSWMAERFEMSDKDNFTMLSGIAHDPIQRDMFTPIFLGAKLIVPTADDIGTPGRLAKWMQVNDITVTHLTPAMGQVLASQAVDEVPTLRNAFFVGDLLTRKDCLRLQSLAKNVHIINMYGTTETQRAVSYFLVKSYNEDKDYLYTLKDIVPAGQGMKNVQLLVVNRYDPTQTCGIGEVGELFVRAGGLAEGYCKLPEMNAKKFLNNWFIGPEAWEAADKALDKGEEWRSVNWKGPRDRLYRTGDLGRYLPDGNVEVTGRIDDQIKIRGFRIELGEIDTHVSKFPVVRENRTIVKKDENGENYLLSFLVLKSENASIEEEYLSNKFDSLDFSAVKANEDLRTDLVKSLAKYHKLATGLKKFLATRLANYALPSIVVVLPKFPLNPNGKIDKNKLPVPTSEELASAAKFLYELDDGASSASADQFNETQSKIKQIWYDILPTKPIINHLNDSFFDLGGHSILATRMIFQIRKEFNVDLPLGTIFKHPTIEAFAAQVENNGATEEASAVSQPANGESEYFKDAKYLSTSRIAGNYPTPAPFTPGSTVNAFITGTTGFLGSFLIKQFLNFKSLDFTVYAHVRASSEQAGFERLVKSLKSYGNYDPSFESRIKIVVGDLATDKFGLEDSAWKKLNDAVDVIVHNGAMVHWVYPYEKLRDSNVISTINVFNMALVGKPKVFEFVSSTSTIDTDHYFNLSDKLASEGKPGLPESNDLMGSSSGLGTGYGQTKWAAEYIIRKAGANGLKGHIVRPGYVTGASNNGASNTDDFLLRILKGCIEIGALPEDVDNTTNAVPVDHVAKIILSTTVTSLLGEDKGIKVAHVTGHPRIKLNDYLDTVNHYGYSVDKVNYESWKTKLEQYVSDSSNPESALFPLLHMVLGDLKADTRAPELDDANTIEALKYTAKLSGTEFSVNAAGQGLDLKQLGVYISYLVQIGFLPKPSATNNLPAVEINPETLKLVLAGAGGRGSAAK